MTCDKGDIRTIIRLIGPFFMIYVSEMQWQLFVALLL